MPEDIFDDLLRPEDDRAWKLAVGHAIREIRETTVATRAEALRTSVRVGSLEAWRNRLVGALGLFMLAAPLATSILLRVFG